MVQLHKLQRDGLLDVDQCVLDMAPVAGLLRDSGLIRRGAQCVAETVK